MLVVQTKDARVFREDEIRMLVEAADQVAPVVSEARTLDRFIAPAQERLWSLARNIWWSWDHDSISLFRDLNPTRWRQLNQNPIALLSEMPLDEIERRATELVLHSRINYCLPPPAASICSADRTWGAANAGVLRPRPVAYFSAEFGLHESLPIYSGGWACWPAITSRAPPTSAFRWSASACSMARATSSSGSTKAAGSSEEYLQTDVNQLPMQPAIGLERRAGRD